MMNAGKALQRQISLITVGKVRGNAHPSEICHSDFEARGLLECVTLRCVPAAAEFRIERLLSH
jgi:hypothetical protein